MNLSIHIRRIFASILCFAMIFAALAPAITHASAGGNWAELCTMDGVKLVKISNGDPAPAKSMGIGEHCAYCLVHVNLSAPVTFSAELIHPLEVSEGYPVLYFDAPRCLASWSSPQSRAPPANS